MKPRSGYIRRSLTGLLLALAVLVPTGYAHAQPSPDEIEDQINEKWRELEPLIEEYNRVRSELKASEKESQELAEKITPLELRVTVAMSQLEDLAAHYYKGGRFSAANALLGSGSPTAFMDQLTVLDLVAREQQERIAEVNAARAEFEQEKAEVDALVKEQEEQKSDLAGRKKDIEAELAELEELHEQAVAQQAEQERGQQQAVSSGDCPAVAASGKGATAAGFACAQRGKPYGWGANGPDAYDCSGLTQASWRAAGVSLTHHTGAQWNEGQPVSRSNAVPGDLVFFYSDLSHVGLYIGAGLMVHSPRAGQVVQISDIDTMPIAGFRRPG